jgi:hypothetical protein
MGNMSSLTRPVKFRFTSVSSSSDPSAVSTSVVDPNGNSDKYHEAMQNHHRQQNNSVMRSQAEFFNDRSVKPKLLNDSYYA